MGPGSLRKLAFGCGANRVIASLIARRSGWIRFLRFRVCLSGNAGSSTAPDLPITKSLALRAR